MDCKKPIVRLENHLKEMHSIYGPTYYQLLKKAIPFVEPATEGRIHEGVEIKSEEITKYDHTILFLITYINST